VTLPASAIARDALRNYLGVGRSGQQREVPFAAVGSGGKNTTGRDMEQLLERMGGSQTHEGAPWAPLR
jgi:hypothetical protein